MPAGLSADVRTDYEILQEVMTSQVRRVPKSNGPRAGRRRRREAFCHTARLVEGTVSS